MMADEQTCQVGGEAIGDVARFAARALTTLLSRGSSRLSILIFHRVMPITDELFPEEMTAARFDATMAAVAATFNVLPLYEALGRLHDGSLPPRAVAVTFDDGYADNAAIACPILMRHGLHATFFVASGFLDGGIMWNDEVVELVRGCTLPSLDLAPLGLTECKLDTVGARRSMIERLLPKLKYMTLVDRAMALSVLRTVVGAESPSDLMMTSGQVRSLVDAGMEVGGHTSSHPILAVLPSDVARDEIAINKERLTAIIGHPPRIFAYPNGKPGQDYLPEHVAMVRAAGYQYAVTTEWGTADIGTDPFQLPRFTPWDRDPTRFVFRLARGFGWKASER